VGFHCPDTELKNSENEIDKVLTAVIVEGELKRLLKARKKSSKAAPSAKGGHVNGRDEDDEDEDDDE
jgi:hypothetical protein